MNSSHCTRINPLRLDYIDARAGLSGKQVLDVGCGGILAESMAARGATVTGIDMGGHRSKWRGCTCSRAGQHVDYRQVPVEQLAGEMPAQFDVVTCMEMLERTGPGVGGRRLCHPGQTGRTGVLLDHHRNPKSYLFAIVGAGMCCTATVAPRYAKFIRPSSCHVALDTRGGDSVYA